MIDRRLVIARAVAAGLTAILSLTIMAFMPREAELSGGWRTPIIALELAEKPADVAFLAGADAAELRADVDRGHAFDMLFPFAYAGLLLLTLLLSTPSKGLRLAGGVATVLTVANDISENLVLLELTARLGRDESVESLFGPLAMATWSKWLAIAALAALIGLARWSSSRPKAVLCAPVVVLTIAAAVMRTPATGELMAGAVVLTIAAFVVGGLVGLRRPS